MELAQQIDIMPTVLGYLGYQKPFVAFGQNLLNRKDGQMAINYTASTYQLFMDDMVLLYNGKANGLYNYRSDSLLQQNLLNQYPDKEHAMEQKLKGIIQQYNQRMIDDKLRVE
jgi:phosphoglycerol transferase MdoB-like AlkP superfamily enzyme